MQALRYWGNLQPGIPTILCIPGSMTSPCVFSQVEVPGGWQLAAIDYGASEGAWDVDTLGKRLVAMIRELAIEPTILVGYSAGGVIAMSAVNADPNIAAGLLFSNTGPSAKGQGDPSFPQRILEQWGEPDFLDAFLARCFSRPIPPVLRHELLQYISSIDKTAVYEVSKSLREVDYRDALRRITCPVTVAHGKDDKVRTEQHVAMITESIPHAKVMMLDGGHTIVVENKERWQHALNHLVAEVSARRAM